MRSKLSLIAVLLLAVVAAACGPNLSTNIPTVDPNAATTEPSVVPNSELAEEGTPEATAEETVDTATADMTAEATAEGTAAPETAFSVQITGETEAALNSEEGATVTNEVAGASPGTDSGQSATTGTDTESANTSGQSVLNTPPSVLRVLQFTDADQSYLFELTMTDELAPGQYEIGINNVQSTIGDNVNQNSQSDSGTEATAEAGVVSTAEASTPEALQEAAPTSQTGGNSDTLESSNNPPPSTSDQGIVERDETFAPTIAARLEVLGDEPVSYNLLQSGVLRIEDMSESSASGSFEFTLAVAEDTSRTITVTGTFADIPLVQTIQSEAEAAEATETP